MTALYRLPTTFQTSRYHLRQATPDDAQAIFDAYGKDRNVTRYLAWRPHESVSDTAAFLQIAAAQWDRGTGFAVVARPLAQPDQVIGMFHPQLFGHRVSYGYVLRASAWGQGCASEVMRWLVDHALSHPAIHRAEAFCDADNPASARVMEKAGMQREGLLRRYFVHPNISDAPRDCLIYAKVR
ncbi:GNAT family N-acetyltransferase [Ketogulonicigenium vulgare]|uniref:GNAT family N-acetyltransferase n=1 Tax=Ketogulonicigenium vulgare TaxID=92945 RepID=UPI0023593B19|nr:GNAT family protein [Ketogulonicigenium vulgare]